MVEVSINLLPSDLNSLDLHALLIILLILIVPKLTEFILYNIKYRYESPNPKKIQDIFISENKLFRYLKLNLDEITRDVLYHGGKRPSKNHLVKSLAIIIIFGFISIYITLYFEAFFIKWKYNHDILPQYENITLTITLLNKLKLEYLMLSLDTILQIFLVTALVQILLLFKRAEYIRLNFPIQQNISFSWFSHVFSGTLFKKIQLISYGISCLFAVNAIQSVMALSLFTKIYQEYKKLNQEITQNMVIFVGIITVLFLSYFITDKKIIKYRIQLNRLVTLLELKKLPQAKIYLTSGNILEGFVFNPLTDKTYLILVNPENLAKIYIHWKNIDGFELESL